MSADAGQMEELQSLFEGPTPAAEPAPRRLRQAIRRVLELTREGRPVDQVAAELQLTGGFVRELLREAQL